MHQNRPRRIPISPKKLPRPKLPKHGAAQIHVEFKGGPFDGQHMRMRGVETLTIEVRGERGFYKIGRWRPSNDRQLKGFA